MNKIGEFYSEILDFRQELCIIPEKKRRSAMMKKSLVGMAVLGASILYASGDISRKEISEGVGYIKTLGKELKGEMKKRMKDDPTGLQAAYFCAKSADDITKKVNAAFPEGVRVYRTALKYRNPDNRPDATDKEVMEKMVEALKNGNFEKRAVAVEMEDGAKRVYVPLLTGKTCLKCHGEIEKIDPKVKETITKKYPEDKATGFKEGELRGVIVAEMKSGSKEGR